MMIRKATLCTLSAALLVSGADDAMARRERPSRGDAPTAAVPVQVSPDYEKKEVTVGHATAPSQEIAAQPVAQPAAATPTVDNSGLPVVNMDQLPISYSVADQNDAGLAKIELYYTTNDGKSWVLYGEDGDVTPPFEFKVPADARYGFYTVATDKAGNIEPTPMPGSRPHVSVVVDRQAPVVTVIEPSGSTIYNGSDMRTVRWRASDLNLQLNPITIQSSTDGGASWSDLARDLPNSGQYMWSPSGGSFADVKVRVVVKDLAGNPGVATSDSFMIDAIAPTTAVTVPVVVGSKTFKVPYTAFDKGGSGMASVELWYKLPDQSWKKYATVADSTKSFEFNSLNEGYVQFATVGIDKVGNAQKPPHMRVDAASDIKTVAIDLTAPEVSLLAFNHGGVLRGGSMQSLKWDARDTNLADRAITLQFSSDGGTSWSYVAEGIENSGSFIWTIPNLDTHQALVKITAVDKMGNARSTQSKVPFVIDSTAPESRATFNPGGSRPKIHRTVAPKPTSSQQRPVQQSRSVQQPAALGTGIERATVESLSQPMPIDRFADFDKAFAAGDIATAQAVMARLRQRYPQDAGTWSRNGDLMARHGNHNAAVMSFGRALSIDPQLTDVMRKRSTSYYKMKDYEKAIDDLKMVIKRNGNDAGDFINLGIMNYRNSSMHEAEIYLKKGVQVGGSSYLASWYLAKIAESKNDYRAAVAHWEEVARLTSADKKLSQYHKRALQFKNIGLKKLQ